MDGFELTRLVGSIFRHSTELDGWDRILGLLARAADAKGAVLATHRYSDGKGFVRNFIGVEPWSVGVYESRVYRDNPLLGGAEEFQPGQLVDAFDLSGANEPPGSHFFREMMEPQGLSSMVGIIIGRDAAMFDVISLLGAETSTPVRKHQLELLGNLAEYLVEANRSYKEHEKLRDGRRALEAVLDCQRVATLLLGGDTETIFANSAAKELLGKRDGLELKGDRKLHAGNPKAHGQIRAALEGRREKGPEDTGTVFVSRPSGKRPYCVRVFPVSLEACGDEGDGDLRAVTIIDPETIFYSGKDIAPFRDLYGLTAAETRVVTNLLAGFDIARIAREMSISPETARTHIKRVFNKTGARRQGELVSLVYRLLGTS